MKIDPTIFDKFNHNALPKEEMINIEEELLLNKEANSSLSTILHEYQSREDVDDLIGEDDEESLFAEEIENFFAERCKKNEISASVDVNIKIQRSMENLKISQEDMIKVAERCKVIAASNDATKSLKENLVSFYMGSCLGLTEEEASETVNRLLEGCNELTRKYNQALFQGLDIAQEVEIMTEGMEVKSRFHYLINAMVAIEALNTKVFSSQKDVNETMKISLENYIASTPEPTEEDCESIQTLLVDAIVNNTLLLNGMESAQNLFLAAKSTDSVINFTSEQYDDARIKAEMSLAMWMEYEEGNLTSIESGAKPEFIGVGAATAVEEAKIMYDVANGRKNMDYAVKCLKVLGAIALFMLLGYVGVVMAATLAGFASYALLSLFGVSTIGCIATMAICLPLAWGFAELGVKVGTKIMEKSGQIYDIVVEKLRESIFPKIKEVAQKFIFWLRTKLGGNQIVTEDLIVTI